MRVVPPDFAREFAALQEAPLIPMEIDGITGWMIFAALQLALRHPKFPPTMRGHVESFARLLQERIATTPALAREAENGWDPAFDKEMT